MVDIETSDLVFVKLNDNIFCMALESFKIPSKKTKFIKDQLIHDIYELVL